MSLVGIESIWHRKITGGDFFNIERSTTAGPQGGGGQLFIDIPNAVREGLFTMLALDAPDDINGDWPPGIVDARVIGYPGVSSTLHFDLNRKDDRRYRIRNQNRQSGNSERHPAWTAVYGFPAAPDDVQTRMQAEPHLGDGVQIYLVKSLSGDFYAGFTRGTVMPGSWPQGIGLQALFNPDTPGGLVVPHSVSGIPNVPPVVYRILDAWKRQPNVLLYGPTGTGKTHAMSAVWQLLESSMGPPAVVLETEDSTTPFHLATPPLPLPTPILRDWVTFHQNYGYEDFIVGLRPRPGEAGGSFSLRPRAGKMLELAIKVASEGHNARSAVLLIDEINRGNTSRVFGEFITFMESAYRDVDKDGGVNPSRLPVPLAMLNTEGGQSEDIELPGGGTERLPIPWHFPRHVYTLASMNSVDRTVAPLDSALARRFERIDMRPDLDTLQILLEVNLAAVREKVEDAQEQIAELTSRECAVLVLAQLNYQLATTLGPDFEIGHTYMLPVAQSVTEDEGFRRLAIIWDQAIMPQLYERFLTRQDELLRILRVGEDVPEGYPFQQRSGLFNREAGDRPSLQPVSLESLADHEMDRLRSTFRFLASRL